MRSMRLLAILVALAPAAILAAPAGAAEGELGYVSCIGDFEGPSACPGAGPALNSLDGAFGVAASPDDGHVYATGSEDDALTAFSRVPPTGSLAFVENEFDGFGGVSGLEAAHSVAVSPDGRHVYATGFQDDALAAFARNPTTGSLDFIASYADGAGVIDGLNGARGVAVSPDGAHVYVASSLDDSVAIFVRDPLGGALGFFDHERDGVGGVNGLNGAWGIGISPDGRHLYVGSNNDDSLAAFSRDATSGALGFVEAELDGVGGTSGLAGANDLALSRDGKHLYVTAFDNALTALSRDGLGGGLTFLESELDGVGADGLSVPWALAIGPDDRNVYVASSGDDAVSTFSREPDTPPPNAIVVSGPAGAIVNPSPTFSLGSDDPGFLARFECSVDGGAFAPCASPLTLGPLAAGPHSFQLRAVDTAGNVDPTPARRDFMVVPAAVAPGPPVDGAVTVRVLGKRLRVSRRGLLRLRLRCPASEASPPCRGRVILRTRAKLRLGKARAKRRVVLGRAGFSIAAGRTEVVKLRLGKARQRLLKRKRRARKLQAIVRVRDGAGNTRTVRKGMRAAASGERRGY